MFVDLVITLTSLLVIVDLVRCHKRDYLNLKDKLERDGL